MKHPHSYSVMQSKNVHFGDPCESGYSTTTSSEEGTLQRGFTHTKKQGGFEGESFLKNPKFLEMVSKESASSDVKSKRVTSRTNKRRPKTHDYLESPESIPSSHGSPFSSTSSLSYGIPNHISNSFQGLGHAQDVSGSQENLDELTSSFEDLEVAGHKHSYNDVTVSDDAVKIAAIQHFHESMDNVRLYQMAKPPTSGTSKQYFNGNDHYYDPLHINDVTYGQTKKRVVISTSPSNSSGVGSPQKSSPMKGILKHSTEQSQGSCSSTPTKNYSFGESQDFSKSEENPTSIRNITPPTSTSPHRKSAFVVVKPRVMKAQESSFAPLNQQVQQMSQKGSVYSHTCCRSVTEQTIQLPVTPRDNNQTKRPTTLNYRPIADQLQSPSEHYGYQSQNAVAKSPMDGNIIYIPAQIDQNGVARPVTSGFLPSPKSPQVNKSRPVSNRDNKCRHSNSETSKEKSTSGSPLPSAEVLTNEAVRLKTFIENAEADELKKVLETLLKSKDPGSIHAMTQLFPESKFKSDAAHCVRCHKDFNPREPGRCILPHPERMVTKVSQDAIGADFVCGCCNAAFRLIQMDFYEESTNALLTGHCYNGTHTTDPESVDYRVNGGSAKSCEEFGCIEFYV